MIILHGLITKGNFCGILYDENIFESTVSEKVKNDKFAAVAIMDTLNFFIKFLIADQKNGIL